MITVLIANVIGILFGIITAVLITAVLVYTDKHRNIIAK